MVGGLDGVSLNDVGIHGRSFLSQFNFKPITCVITGAARPGIIRQRALEAAAFRLGKDTLEDSLGSAAACHKLAGASPSYGGGCGGGSGTTARLGPPDMGRSTEHTRQDSALDRDESAAGVMAEGLSDGSRALPPSREEFEDMGGVGADLVSKILAREEVRLD